MSTIEAKYRTFTEAAKEITWARGLLTDLGIPLKGPTTLLYNNLGALKLVKNLVLHSRTKHIELQHHFIGEKTAVGNIEVVFIPIDIQEAGIFTKPIGQTKFDHMAIKIGLYNPKMNQDFEHPATTDLPPCTTSA